MIVRYTEDRFSDMYVSTVGVDFKMKQVDLGDTGVQLQIWDTAGQERFRSITSSYYRSSNAVVIVYDVTNRESFEHVGFWMEQVEKLTEPDVVKYLVANKCESTTRAVSREEGEAAAEQYKVEYAEVSAKEDLNIQELFSAVARALLGVAGPEMIRVPKNIFEDTEVSKKCC